MKEFQWQIMPPWPLPIRLPLYEYGKLSSCPIFGAAKVKRRRRGDKRHCHNADLQKSGGDKKPASFLRPLEFMGLPLLLSVGVRRPSQSEQIV